MPATYIYFIVYIGQKIRGKYLIHPYPGLFFYFIKLISSIVFLMTLLRTILCCSNSEWQWGETVCPVHCIPYCYFDSALLQSVQLQLSDLFPVRLSRGLCWSQCRNTLLSVLSPGLMGWTSASRMNKFDVSRNHQGDGRYYINITTTSF